METSLSSHPSSLSSSAIPSLLRRCRCPAQLQRRGFGARGGRRGRPTSTVVMSFAGKRRGRDFGGELVDENMAILRKRIHELRMAEEGDGGPPEHWMEWEKRHHGSYSAIVCDAVAMLQGALLNTRPSVALGVAALLAVSVPTSAVMVVLRLSGAFEAILRGLLIN